MDDFRVPSTSWGDEVRKYELEKRRCIDEGLVRGTQIRVVAGHNKLQDRAFDPVLQRYRDPSMETQQRLAQDKNLVVQLNKAQDVQLSREQPFHIINHTSKVEAIAPGMDVSRLDGKRTAHGKGPLPVVDYNILSNLPLDVHHWDRPGCAPTVSDRQPKPRTVPAHLVKDFDVITNRYVDNHDERIRCEKELNLREAAHKYAKGNRFDPITQQFNNPELEERARCCDDAREVEANLRYQATIPPAIRNAPSAQYGIVGPEEQDGEKLRAMDQLERRRRDRYKNCHIMEQMVHAQDYHAEQVQQQRWINRAAPERYSTGAIERGHDLVTNQTFGNGPHQKTLHKPLARPRKNPWQKITASRSMSSPSIPLFDGSGVPTGDTLGHSIRTSSTASASMVKPGSGGRGLSGSGSAPHLQQLFYQDVEVAPMSSRAAPFALRGSVPAQPRHAQRATLEQMSRPSAGLTSGLGAPAAMSTAAYASGRFGIGATGEAPPAPKVPGGSHLGTAYSRPIASPS